MKFSEFDFHPSIVAGIEKNQYVECTPVQEAAFPHILEGRDVSGLAQTGTGKTAAFLLPLMNRIAWAQELEKQEQADFEAKQKGNDSEDSSASNVETSIDSKPETAAGIKPEKTKPFINWKQANYILVLVPTRELAEQVYTNVKSFGEEAGFSAVSIYGGTSYDGQKDALNRGVQFIVATPGRLIDLFKDQFVDLNQVRAIVFDEADRMFDMGFKDDMKYILKRIPKDRQFLVFSATLNFDVLNTAYEYGADPVEINVSKDQAKAENVKDELFHVGHNDKPLYLLSILTKHQPKQAIIFSNFKRNVERIAQFLTENGYHAMGISSLLNQSQRNRVMAQFKTENNDRNILVATDVAARGLDVKGVDMVINFELPDDPENYVHRIGRTGRAQAQGIAYSLAGDRDVDALSRIESYLGHKVELGWLEDSDLVTDFKEFPREVRDKKPRYEGNNKKSSHNRGDRKSKDRRPYRKDGDSPSSESKGSKKHPSNKRRRPEGEAATAGAKDSTHRDRKTGRHQSKDQNQSQNVSSGSKKRRRNRKNSASTPARRGRHQKPGTASANRSQQPKAETATIGKKISGFFKRLFQ